MANIVRGRNGSFFIIAGLCVLLLALTACSESDSENTAQANAGGASSNVSTTPNAPAFAGDPAKLDAEIERLEKQAEKNPGNPETLAELARAYVRRGNAHRDAKRLREAMNDYKRAQQNDPDNQEAQTNAAEIAPQVEGEATGEYGEPAPLPITPNVTGGEAKPTPTPKQP